MPVWFVFALLSVGAMAGAELAQKVSMTNKKDISAITNNFFVWLLQGTVGLILALILGNLTLPANANIWLKLGLAGIVYFVGGTLYYTSYKANSASLSIILGSFSVVVSTSLGIFLLHEGATLIKILGIVAVLTAILIVNYTKGAKFSKYNYFALAGGIAWGIGFTIDKSFIISQIHPAMYLALLCYSVAVVSFLLGYKTILHDVKCLVFTDFKPMILSAIFGSLFNIFTFYAYFHGADVGKVDAMNNSMVFLVILGEILFFKDTSNLKRKLLAASIAAIGIWSFTL